MSSLAEAMDRSLAEAMDRSLLHDSKAAAGQQGMAEQYHGDNGKRALQEMG